VLEAIVLIENPKYSPQNQTPESGNGITKLGPAKYHTKLNENRENKINRRVIFKEKKKL
jgi:hypothetical protein